MNTEQFKQLVRAIVQEEIKKTLPDLVPHIVAEALSGKSVKSKLTETDKSDDFFQKLQNEKSRSPAIPSKPKQPRKFTNNPLLNQVLNETQGGVPPDASYGTQIQPPNFKQSSFPLNIQQPTQSPILNEETKAQAQIGIFKDYRKLMKAVDNKKKQGAFGGGSVGNLSIEGGAPTDFNTID